jgi:hypothetical protein
MINQFSIIRKVALGSVFLSSATIALAGPVYQPSGVNLVFGDVTHGQRAQSGSSNPAAAAADVARGGREVTRGTVLSIAAGLEYGNVQELFDTYDELKKAYSSSEPGEPGDPSEPPDDGGGIGLGDIWDSLDPQFQSVVEAVAKEVVTQTTLLGLIKNEGYAKAWLAADAPFVLGGKHFGGTWTYGVNWSGTSKAFGITQDVEFDEDVARAALEDWWTQLPFNRPELLPISDNVLVRIDPVTNAVRFIIDNDSSMLTKATQTTELNLGYSREAWSNSRGNLYIGAEAKLNFMRLSRLSVRFGDITNSEELFDAIRDSNFRNDERIGVDVGALWVAENYQIGAQYTNVNEPRFTFPDVNLDPYSDDEIISFLNDDQVYTMDRQLKLEGSLFTSDRRWSAHLGYDADTATDPMGDKYQWLTVSAGFITQSRWIPSVRIGYRENLSGTRMKYVGIGLTAFKIVNFDIASALNTVSIDGQDLPQGLMVSLGFQLSW